MHATYQASPCQETNPHTLFVIYHILLSYGARHHSLFRSQRKWRRLLTSLVDVVSVDCDEVGTLHPAKHGVEVQR
jgi:hypothetical protein